MSMFDMEIQTLKKEIAQLKENYKSAESQLLTTARTEVDTYNTLKRKMDSILVEIDKAEQKLEKLFSKIKINTDGTIYSTPVSSEDVNIQKEIKYLQSVIKVYQHWTELYTSLQAEAHGGRARPGAAAALSTIDS